MIPHDFFLYILLVTTAYLKHQLKKFHSHCYYYDYFFANESGELKYNKLDWRYIGRCILVLLVHFLSFNEARIIFLLCCVACLEMCMCDVWCAMCVCLPEPVNAIWMFVYYLVVLISWMGTKKLFLGNLWIFLLFLVCWHFLNGSASFMAVMQSNDTRVTAYIMSQTKKVMLGFLRRVWVWAMRKDIKIEYM